MWKTFQPIVLSELKRQIFLQTDEIVHQQIRTTYILKRRFPPKLHRKGEEPKNLKRINYIYDLVKDTNVEKLPQIEVILRSYVDGLGNIGDRVFVKPNYAYNKLLLSGLAVYASPENLERYWDENVKEKEVSSVYALLTVKSLQRVSLSVVMNMEKSWTIQPWHIKAAFRKCGYIVPEYAITLPDKQIVGPDMSLQGKEFFVTVTINNKEKVPVRCRLHHWSTDLANRIPYEEKFWEKETSAILPEQDDVLKTLPKKKCLIRKSKSLYK